MYSLILENQLGNRIELTHSTEYSILDIQGLNPPSATINTSDVSLFDGAKFNSAKVNMRSINISIAINKEAEKNRIELFKVARTKQPIRLYYANGRRDVYVEGYVESFEIDYFAMKQSAAISILCPEPYFKAANELIEEVNLIIGAFHFPFAIEKEAPMPFSYYGEIFEINVENVGDIACGISIEIHASGQVTNPKIFNRETREFFGLTFVMKEGDVAYINTQKGKKEVKLLREGKYINIFNSIAKGSTWLQLETGDNVLTYEGDGSSTDYMAVRFIHHPLYEGV